MRQERVAKTCGLEFTLREPRTSERGQANLDAVVSAT